MDVSFSNTVAGSLDACSPSPSGKLVATCAKHKLVVRDADKFEVRIISTLSLSPLSLSPVIHVTQDCCSVAMWRCRSSLGVVQGFQIHHVRSVQEECCPGVYMCVLVVSHVKSLSLSLTRSLGILSRWPHMDLLHWWRSSWTCAFTPLSRWPSCVECIRIPGTHTHTLSLHQYSNASSTNTIDSSVYLESCGSLCPIHSVPETCFTWFVVLTYSHFTRSVSRLLFFSMF